MNNSLTIAGNEYKIKNCRIGNIEAFQVCAQASCREIRQAVLNKWPAAKFHGFTPYKLCIKMIFSK